MYLTLSAHGKIIACSSDSKNRIEQFYAVHIVPSVPAIIHSEKD